MWGVSIFVNYRRDDYRSHTLDTLMHIFPELNLNTWIILLLLQGLINRYYYRGPAQLCIFQVRSGKVTTWAG